MGKDVSEIFIGRKSDLLFFKKKVFTDEADKESYPSYSLTGPNGIGKTRLINEISGEIKDSSRVFLISMIATQKPGDVDVSYFSYFWFQFFNNVKNNTGLMKAVSDCRDGFMDSVCDKILKILDFYEKQEYVTNITQAISNIYDFFECITELGIRIVWVVDEFDRTRDILKDEKGGIFYQTLFNLTQKAGKNYKLSIVLIARRHVGTIAFGMDGGSNFPDAFPQHALRGFTDADMEEYFGLYDGESAPVLTQEQKGQIIYFCGRHTGLLMAAYGKLQDRMDIYGDAEIDDEDLTEVLHSCIKDPYERMVNLMKTEYVDIHREETFLNKFIQVFIGPAYDPAQKLVASMEIMKEYGFITQIKDKDGYKSLAKLFDEDWNVSYDPLAPYFALYLESDYLAGDANHTNNLLRRLETLVREIIKIRLIERFGGDWKNHIDEILGTYSAEKKESFYEKLKEQANLNMAKERKISYSKLDVLAFYEYFFFIKKDWEAYKKYFPDYDDKSVLEADFQKLTSARNPFAHVNEMILSHQSIEKIQQLCEKMLIGIEKGMEK